MASRISFSSPSLLANKHGMHKPHPPFSCKLVMSRTVTTGRKSLATSMVALTPATAPEAKTSLARIWREIQGCDDWGNLMKPLNPLLRQEIVRYGEFVIACYKALDLDPKSKCYLNCKFGKRSMLREVGMAACGYEVTKYIYSTPDIGIPTQSGKSCSPWVGYVAVSSDNEAMRLGRRDILVCFRGTVTNAEWIANFMSSLTPARLDPNNPRPDVKVELGFLSLYTSHDSTCKFSPRSCREQVLSELSRIINEFKGEEVSITLAGHSMGSALALLLAYDLAELGLNGDGLNRQVPITVYSFGGPRVGNLDFKMRCEELGVKVLRVVNVKDPVTKLPGIFLNENSRILAGRFEFPWSCSCYAHVGVELALDFFQIENPTCVHDLDTYIGLLKCPKVEQVQRNGVDFLRKARNLFTKQTFDVWPWQDAAIQVGNLVQALGI